MPCRQARRFDRRACVLLAAVLLAAVLLALAPASASGATFFVDAESSGDPACSQAAPCTTINEAVVASRANSEVDTIKIATGLYLEQLKLMDPKDTGLTIEGSGSGSDPATSTVIQAEGASAGDVVVLGAPAGAQTRMTVRNLRLIKVPFEDRGTAIIMNAASSTLENVYAMVSGPADDALISVRNDDARLERVTAQAMGQTGMSSAQAVYSDADKLTVFDSDILGAQGGGLGTAAAGDLVLVRSRVTATPDAETALAVAGRLTADSSLISGGAIGFRYFGGDPTSPNRDANLRGVTIDAGQPGVADPAVNNDQEQSGYAISQERDSVNVRLDSSIALERSISYGGEVRCGFSKIPSQQEAADPIEGTGPIACGHGGVSGNFSSLPSDLFADAPGGDYRLKPGSPAYDRGSTRALEAGESSFDLARAVRTASAQGVCPSRRDQGAYETQTGFVCAAAQPDIVSQTVSDDVTAPLLGGASLSRRVFRVGSRPTPLVTGSRRRAPAGTTLRFTLSEAARVKIAIEQRLRGRRVGRRCRPATRRLRKRRACVRWKRAGMLTRDLGAGQVRVPFSGRVGRRALSAGRYRFVITAEDASGNGTIAPVRRTFRIVKR